LCPPTSNLHPLQATPESVHTYTRKMCIPSHYLGTNSSVPVLFPVIRNHFQIRGPLLFPLDPRLPPLLFLTHSFRARPFTCGAHQLLPSTPPACQKPREQDFQFLFLRSLHVPMRPPLPGSISPPAPPKPIFFRYAIPPVYPSIFVCTRCESTFRGFYICDLYYPPNGPFLGPSFSPMTTADIVVCCSTPSLPCLYPSP